MEPPAKRQRLGLGLTETEDADDELDFDPEELNRMRDPDYQLEQARDRSAYKLKSTMEDIFAKYGQDFTGIGDEIDLRTGEVVVDNGHLQSMEIMDDIGEEDDQVSEQEEERIMHGTRAPRPAVSDAAMRRDPWAVGSRVSPMMGEPPRLSSMMSPSRNSLMTPPQSFNSFDSGTTIVVDPAWQAPDLPRSAFLGGSFDLKGRQYGFGMGASTKQVTRKTLPAPHISDEEDEDVLLGVSGNAPKQKQTVARSPLIKEKFPTVDSSPNNDSSLNELIQEVIENLPETPPSVQKSLARKPETKWQRLGSMNPSQTRLALEKPRRKVGRPPKDGSRGTKLAVSKEMDGTSLTGSPTGANRGRKHSNSLGGRAGAAKQASGQRKRASRFQEGDLDLYQDVTGLPTTNSSRPLYVEIEARNVGKDVSHAEQATHKSKRTRLDEDAAKSQRQRLTPLSGIEPGKQGSKPSNGQGTFEPNVIDPVFAFSDEENLPPKRTKKDRRKSEPARLAVPQVLQASPPNLQQNPPAKYSSGRNIIDPSYAFSDEENVLPRRAKPTKRIPDPAGSAKLSAETNSSAGQRTKNEPVSEPKETPDIPLKPNGRQQAKSSLRKPKTNVGTTANETKESPLSDTLASGGEAESTPLPTDTDVPRSHYRRRRGTESRPASFNVHDVNSTDQETGRAKSKPRSTRPGIAKRRPSRARRVETAGSPELGEPSFEDAGPAAGVEEGGPETEPVSTAASLPSQQPSTPQSRSKAVQRKTPSSKPALISLLSDNEDEEDEISFDLSAFTPSGHHRILAHRLNSSVTVTPHMTSSSTASNKKRASSLLFGPSSTSKIHKHRTPGSERKGGRGKRRDSTNSLARSVVKVRRESFREPSPAGSLIQTPGGTKRRCGQDGFRCERDFCFVCISI